MDLNFIDGLAQCGWVGANGVACAESTTENDAEGWVTRGPTNFCPVHSNVAGKFHKPQP